MDAPRSTPLILAATSSQTRYCAVALYLVGKSEPVWLHHEGKIVVFDQRINAQDCLELLAEGRDTVWFNRNEECAYQPIDPRPGKTNRAVIVTGYDPYHLPAGHAVASETRGKEWHRHIHWGHWIRGVTGVS
jgi:hypothetical protein